tara:strand:- start:253 stop:810 length:558 start_codon:yes stop_codon:yes gene_type:complete
MTTDTKTTTQKRETGNGPERRKNFRSRRGRGPRRERPRPEFEQKIINIRRVTRVVRGGRRFSFSVGLVAGDKKGSVGVGLGKAGDTALAIEKAARNAKKNMITVKLTKKGSIPHESQAKYTSSEVMLMPAPGKGIIAGSSARTVLELAGIKEVGAKFLSRSKNKVNNARATIKALNQIEGTVKKK